eukprot:g27902.t1
MELDGPGNKSEPLLQSVDHGDALQLSNASGIRRSRSSRHVCVRVLAPPVCNSTPLMTNDSSARLVCTYDDDDSFQVHDDDEDVPNILFKIEDEGGELEEPPAQFLKPAEQKFCVTLLGLGFLMLYTAFGSAKNYMTKLFGKEGSHSLALLYLCFGIFSLAAPSYTGRLGARKCIVFGALTFCIFVLSMVLQKITLIFVASLMAGVGASLMWNGQALYLTKVGMGPSLATLTGLFFSLYSSNGVLGNLMLSVLLANHLSITISFSVLLAVGGTGTLLLSLLPSSHCRSPVPLPPPWRQTVDSFKMFARSQLLSMVPLFVIMGQLPVLVSGALPPRLDNTLVAKCFLVHSCCNVLFCWFWGYVLTQLDWRFVSASLAGVTVAATSVTAVALKLSDNGKSVLLGPIDATELCFYSAYGLFGAVDAAVTTLVMNGVGLAFPKLRGPAFGCFRFTCNTSQSLGFLLYPYIDVDNYLVFYCIFMMLSVSSFAMVARKIDWKTD